MAKDSQIDFNNLDFESFSSLAGREDLSVHEKVGFPDKYRLGFEDSIFADICTKLSAIETRNVSILEIGPGCSNLPRMLSSLCKKNGSRLTLIDSKEMLGQLPDERHVTKIFGKFPQDCETSLVKTGSKFDAILVYSVIQYVFEAGHFWEFVDECFALLAEKGEILIGDIPNSSMRKRFFASETGKRAHHEYIGAKKDPEVVFNQIERGVIDDSVIFSILNRARSQGLQAWVVPQNKRLPMANRREDILIRKP
jgi:hypothetical protein